MSLSRGPPTQPRPRGLGRPWWSSPPGVGDLVQGERDGEARTADTGFTPGATGHARDGVAQADGRIVAAGDAETRPVLAAACPDAAAR